MPDHDVSVEVINVKKRVLTGDVPFDVLRGINMTSYKGETHIITGPSGAGKTTLLSVLAGTLRFDSGDVTVFGTSLKNLNENQLTEYRKKKVGFIFQQFHLLKTLSVADNVCIPLLLNGYDKNEAMEMAIEMIKKVGLAGKEKTQIFHLSTGEQQRSAIARALIHQPPLLICDEPTASLDAINGAHIMQLISEVAKSPERSVIVVTHDPRIFEFGDRISFLEDGEIIGTHERKSEG